MNNTLVFNTYLEFLNRENRETNGVSPKFAEEHPTYKDHNKTNVGCWNSLFCEECFYSSFCYKCKSCIECQACENCQNSQKCVACNNITNKNKGLFINPRTLDHLPNVSFCLGEGVMSILEPTKP